MCKHAGLKSEFLKSWHQLFIVEVIIAHMIMRDPKGTSFKMTLNKQTTKWHLCNLVHFGIEFVVSSFVVNTHTLNFSLMYAKIGHFSTFHEVFFFVCEVDFCTQTRTRTHTMCWQFNIKCLNVPNKRPAGEQKEMWNKKQTSNEIITIQRESERCGCHNGREQSRRVNGKKKCVRRGGVWLWTIGRWQRHNGGTVFN